ncbi:MAG: isopentenyl-diphosphate Delta-isomerase [Oscillospiraceae bacterium]|nr:isopentenyl-diphosphate Delta-isomerase [Oscillospiraceae bacterium]
MEELILVDLDDRQIGTMGKAEAHRLGRLHRAFSVFIVDGSRMLIQQRSRQKYHSGGLWANACCSHPRHGETLPEATARRLREELGISCELRELFDFVYFSKYAEDLFEYEYDHVFVGEYSGECSFDPEEIGQLRWISFGDLKQELLTEPERFCSWFRIAAPKVMRILERT